MSDSKVRSRSGSRATDSRVNLGHTKVRKEKEGFSTGKIVVGALAFTAVIYFGFFRAGGPPTKKYAVIIDAGSTGSRVNGYEFDLIDGNLKLKSSLFEEVKPGLSSYADKPKDGAKGLEDLIGKAKNFIPEDYWSSTPIALKATAGLRLLPKEKADAILAVVEKTVKGSGFLANADSVGIMDGMDEGIFSWFTLNFLLGLIDGPVSKTVAALDLGGGSTQITVASNKENSKMYAMEDVESLTLAGQKVLLYTHSYLGLGLQSARKSVLSVNQKDSTSKILQSPCVLPGVSEEWTHQGETYTVKGAPAKKGQKEADWDECYNQIVKLIQEKGVIKTKDLNRQVVLFSYFFERAVDVGLVDEVKGGKLTINQYLEAGKKACQTGQKEAPLLCLDLSFMGAILHDGYGLSKDTSVLAIKKIDGYEVNWALGMAYQILTK